MKEYNSAIAKFTSLAEERLNNHLMELNTRYGNELPESRDLLRQAYEEHRKIFSQELDQEKENLAGSENPWLSGELDNIQTHYLNRLQPGETQIEPREKNH
jgi:hypothetical protein